jgi:hypothetical protein
MKKVVVITINAILVLVIAALITATWMPVIYNTPWFQVHVLHNHSTK